ncbi:LysM peptidoglycan-binding domain-containing protein [Sporomusa sphaeroides]|uniref:LysM domain-containing protein n=1 Tax=Sporomusa sphaeroides DSM 2875 TaxID=1337886 RepID=A0ABM9W3M1_9FIRM|nr:LysM domain-containing protein [Sporomusa sphaeroides]OLS56411.1 hypothetical protein SPSPH_28040 [Sporomusa sphaeroides DSM 2875]CVK18506.1 hypothetical protein SSPH_01144 [Sporomusa sphaeroides DSM 2875]
MKRIVIAGLIALAVASCGNAGPKGHLVTETYTVKSGDTLDAISLRYMAKSAVRRDVREFREGIIQENWDAVFKDRQPYGLIHPGDRLTINYWKE